MKKAGWVLLPTISILIMASLFISISTPVAAADDVVKASEGQFDLRNKVLTEDGPFKLNGDWEFYWEKLLTPEEVAQNSPVRHFVSIPSTWNHYVLDEQPLSQHGYATYRLTLVIDEAEIGKLVSLYIPSVATAYNLWVDGQLVASNGRVAETRQQMIPQNYPKVVTFTADRPEIELVLQASNFHQRKAGLWEPITFGTEAQVTALRERNILFQAAVVGSIVIIGFYHFVMFFQRPKELSPLFFAIASFGVALRTLLLRDTLLIYLFPQFSWELAVSLEYLAALIALLFFLLFVRREFSLDLPSKLIRVFIVVVVLYSIFIAVTPARIYTETFTFFRLLAFLIILSTVIVSFLGVIRKREGAYLNVVAMLILFVAVLNDIFYYSQWIATDELVSAGLLFYLFSQSIHIARRFSRSFDHVEKLSDELRVLNHSLEQKVEQRTAELQEANKQLQKVEQARRRLLASVSHELKTPLTFIQGYIKAMIDGVVSNNDSSYLRAVFNDTKMMARIIEDLQELTRLESGQVTFQYEHVEIGTLFAQLYEEQRAAVEKNGFHFRYIEKRYSSLHKPQVVCLIDPVRIKQVYLNLLINAQKFTTASGTITVEVELPSVANAEVIKVSVTDTGAGIAKADLPYIFDRFYKVTQLEDDNGRGAGLGLAIVKEIVEYHNGSVGVDSEQGKGSVFYFTLPIVKMYERGEEHTGEKGKSVSR